MSRNYLMKTLLGHFGQICTYLGSEFGFEESKVVLVLEPVEG